MIPNRFKLVFFPFVIILTVLVVGWSAFHWFFLIRPDRFVDSPIDMYIVTPGIFSSLFVLCWLFPRSKRLTFLLNRHDSLIAFQLIAIALITTCVYYSQILLENRYATVIPLDGSKAFENQKKSKFYTAEHGIIKKGLMAYYFLATRDTNSLKAGGGARYKMSIYFVFPLYFEGQKNPALWVGIYFDGDTGNSYFESTLKELQNYFIRKSFKKLQRLSVKKIQYLERMTDNRLISDFDDAVLKSPLGHGTRTVLLARYKPLKKRLFEDVSTLIVIWLMTIMSWFMVVALLAKDDETPHNNVSNSKKKNGMANEDIL